MIGLCTCFVSTCSSRVRLVARRHSDWARAPRARRPPDIRSPHYLYILRPSRTACTPWFTYCIVAIPMADITTYKSKRKVSRTNEKTRESNECETKFKLQFCSLEWLLSFKPRYSIHKYIINDCTVSWDRDREFFKNQDFVSRIINTKTLKENNSPKLLTTCSRLAHRYICLKSEKLRVMDHPIVKNFGTHRLGWRNFRQNFWIEAISPTDYLSCYEY